MPTFVGGQDEELMPEMTQSMGLGSNAIRALKLDKRGALWVGTDNGLNILNSTIPWQDTLIGKLKNSSIWGIEFFEDRVFIGTRYDGLFIFKEGQRLHIEEFQEIRQIRKIKVSGNKVFIITNSHVYIWSDNFIKKIEKFSTELGEFIIDVFYWDGIHYGIGYPNGKIFELVGDKFIHNPNDCGFGINDISIHHSLYSSTVYKDKIYLAGASVNPFIIIIEKGSPNKRKINLKLGAGFIPWDMLISNDVAHVALGDVFSNQFGLLYSFRIDEPIPEPLVQSFTTCLALDTLTNNLYFGTLFNGLHMKPANMMVKNLINESENKLKTEIRENKNYNSNTTLFSLGDTLVHIKDKELFVTNKLNNKQLMRIGREEKIPFAYVNDVLFYSNRLYLFSNYGTVLSCNTTKPHKLSVESIPSNLPYPQIGGDKIILLNREKGFGVITENGAFELRCKDENIGFIDDYTVIGDTIFTLANNEVNAYIIKIDSKELIFHRKLFSENTKIEGFHPKWIFSNLSRLFISNEKGIVELKTNEVGPLGYFYFGNFDNVRKPIIKRNLIVINSDNQERNISLNEIFPQTKNALSEPLQLASSNTIFENAPYEIRFKHPSYFIQNRSLKGLELWKGNRLFLKRYTIESSFQFPNGLPAGTYNIILNDGLHEIQHSLKVKIPLNRNPYFLIGSILFIVSIGVVYAKLYIDRKELNRKLDSNRLQILKQNLNPHFVYNSMNLISSLILEKKYDEAIQVVADFAKLQRSHLETNNKAMISLRQELDFLELYLKLQQIRFKFDNSFSYTIGIQEGLDVELISIPPLILQPMVENSIKHGLIFNGNYEKMIKISVSGTKPTLIAIEDNGKGQSNESSDLGMGQKLVMERIAIFNRATSRRIKIHFGLPAQTFEKGYRVEIYI